MTVTSTLGSQTEDNRKGASCIQPQDGAKFAITLISCSQKFDNFHPWRVQCLKQTDLQLSTTQHGRSILLLLAQLVRNLPALVIVAPGLHVGKHMHTGRNTFCTPSRTQFRIYHSCTVILHRATPSSDSFWIILRKNMKL